MEASGAGLAAASGDGAAQGQQDGQAQQGATGADGQSQQAPQGDAAIAQLMEQLQGMSAGQEEMRQFLASQAQQQQQTQSQQQEQEQQQSQQADLSFLDETSPNYDPAKAAERLTQVMQEQAAKAFQEQLAPVQQQVTDMRVQQESDALIAEFPELGTPEVGAKVMQAVERHAAIVGQPELAANAEFIRLTYMAGRAAELAQQQQNGASNAPGVATLEGAAGASPGGQQSDPAAAIKESWSGRPNVLAKL